MKTKESDLINFKTEANLWIDISELANLLVTIFSQNSEGMTDITLKLNCDIEDLPPFDENKLNTTQKRVLSLLDRYYFNLKKMFPQSEEDVQAFVRSSEFTTYRDYFAYIIHIVAAHDLLVSPKDNWIAWLLDISKPYVAGLSSQFNPINAMEVGTLTLIFGIEKDLPALVDQGKLILKQVKPHLEFQSHHLLAIEILSKLSEIYKTSSQNIAQILTDIVTNFLETNQISPNSVLFQRTNLYLAMLQMLNETGIFMKKSNERFVAFDPFSWIQTTENIDFSFPYMPLNTSLDNLNSN